MHAQSKLSPTVGDSLEFAISCKKAATEKAWGISVPLYKDQHIEVVKISVRRGGYSSQHKHLYKDNIFWVIRGRIIVIRYTNASPVENVLTPRDGMFSVPAGIEHRFIALEDDTVVYELYCATEEHEVESSDIIRRDQGGIANDRSLKAILRKVSNKTG